MQKIILELKRLYLPPGALADDALAQQLLGHASRAVSLTGADGLTRAMVIPFHKRGGDADAQHWDRLCVLANALQAQLGLPAPAVSISGADGYGLWLSLQAPVPAAQAQAFLALVCAAYCPDLDLRADAASAPVELPPCLHQGSGRWAAFIHPGMGAAFADEAGLEMAPPFAGQAAFLEGLQSISDVQFRHAMATLGQAPAAAPVASAAAPDGLLLRDATLDDIVQWLHAKHIEPTFRHLIPGAPQR